MKPTVWIGSTKKDLKCFPVGVQRAVGRALQRAHLGRTPGNAKVLRGFGGAGVLEVVENHDGDTYRAVYTIKLDSAVLRPACFSEEEQERKRNPDAPFGTDPKPAC